jgi:hypothetical protein
MERTTALRHRVLGRGKALWTLLRLNLSLLPPTLPARDKCHMRSQVITVTTRTTRTLRATTGIMMDMRVSTAASLSRLLLARGARRLNKSEFSIPGSGLIDQRCVCRVPNSAPVHGSSGNGYNSYQNNSYNSSGQQYSNYGYPNGPQSAQPYYNQGNYLSGNSTSASQWGQQPWSGGVNPQAMSGYSSTYNRGVPPQPQALAAAAQAANQFPGSHTKTSPAPLYSQGTMPPQAVQGSMAPQQASTLPPPAMATGAALSINPQAVANDYAGLGKRSAEDAVPVSAGGTKKTKLTKKEEKEKAATNEPPAPTKSHLKPPKQAHSAWQLFFTDQLNAAKANAQPDSKLNVAHVAKDAGELYKHIAPEVKAEYARRAAEAREVYHQELEAWKATLTPEDIKLENAFRAAQRKAGKSRKGNMKDTNAPKKPLSAYFLFLKAIRTSAELTKRVFETETETTKQSMMAAKRWRSFDDEQKKVCLSLLVNESV